MAPAAAPAFASSAPAPAPPKPAEAAWTPVEAPVWTPGEAIPAEPLGSGVAVAEAPSVPTPAPAPRFPTSPPPARRPSVPRPPLGGGVLADRPPWLIPAAVAAVIVLLLGIVGVKLLTSRGGTNSGQVAQTTPSPHASSTPHASPTATPGGKTPLAVPTTFGPASADPVKSVQICSAASPCNIPGSTAESATVCDLSSCKVEVAVYFTAVQKSVNVTYTLKFFDRCSGQTTDLPGSGTTTPASGYIVAIPTDHLNVNIPAGVKSGALIAVAQTPAVAASAPLLLGSQTSCA